MEELLIPYFAFRDLPKRGLLLVQVYINRNKFSDVQFSVQENELTITSEKHKKKWFCAKIMLPTRIRNSEDSDVTICYNEAVHRYELILKKYVGVNASKCTSPKISNIDVISKFVSWKHDVQEEPDDLQSTTEILSQLRNQLRVADLTNETEDESIARSIAGLQLSADSCANQPVVDSSSDIPSTRGDPTSLYGFASKYRNSLKNFEGNWSNVIELPDPENTSIQARKISRWEQERQAFDIEYYLADYFLEQVDEEHETVPLLHQIMNYKPYWHRISKANEKVLTPEQMTILVGLPCKNFALKETERLEVLHSLFDIILAYAYDYRINCGKHSSESAWNISKLSATFSWLQVHENVGEAVDSFFRRSLTFPLYRFWLLSSKVFDDALEIFYLGRRQLLNCLICIHELFDADDDRRILNEIYVEDYLIWVQQVHPQTIKNYVSVVESCRLIRKQDVFSILPAIEQKAIEVIKSDDGYDLWHRKMSDLISLRNQDYLNTGEKSSSEDESSTESGNSDS